MMVSMSRMIRSEDMSNEGDRYLAGKQPYDPLNGF
jgi:hypothetical protein